MIQRKLSQDEKSLWENFTRNIIRLDEPNLSHSNMPLKAPQKAPEANSLDLHGVTLEKAYNASKTFLSAVKANHRNVLVITGLSGEIKREFPLWFDQDSSIRKIEEINGGGAYRIYFKKPKKSFQMYND